MAQVIDRKTLFEAGVSYGHSSKRWNPAFSPFIFMKKNNTHIINVDKTLAQLELAGEELKKIAQEGGRVLFVGRKKQAKAVLEETAKRLDQPYVTLRWLGGTITNFSTIKKLIKESVGNKSVEEEVNYEHLTKREKLIKVRKRAKQELILGGLASINRLPGALFVVDVNREITAIKEARKMNIPVFAIVDTNASPEWVDYPIPANDDKEKAIRLIVDYLSSKIEEGLQIWKQKKASEESAPATTPKF